MKPNRITVSHTKRGTTIKATGHAAIALFNQLAVASEGGLNVVRTFPCQVHFEDQGQAALRWDVDEKGDVAATHPEKDEVWVGAQLMTAPVPGEFPMVKNHPRGKPFPFRFPIRVTKVTRLIQGAKHG